jgi:predicted hydrolase (HD superfamily)
MVKSNLRYRVTLTCEERETLEKLVRQGRTAGYRIRHAQILLALDEVPENAHWTDAAIGAAYQAGMRSAGTIRKRFVEEGFTAALERKKRETPPAVKIDGAKEARIIAEACSNPPEGHARWTLRLLAERMVERGVFDSISAAAIGTTLKKTKLNLGGRRCGAYRKPRPHLSPRWKTF